MCRRARGRRGVRSGTFGLDLELAAEVHQERPVADLADREPVELLERVGDPLGVLGVGGVAGDVDDERSAWDSTTSSAVTDPAGLADGGVRSADRAGGGGASHPDRDRIAGIGRGHAPAEGLEPSTCRLTAGRSAVELRGIGLRTVPKPEPAHAHRRGRPEALRPASSSSCASARLTSAAGSVAQPRPPRGHCLGQQLTARALPQGHDGRAAAAERHLAGQHDRGPHPLVHHLGQERRLAHLERRRACASRPTRPRASPSPRPTPRGRRPSTAGGRAGPAASAPAGPAPSPPRPLAVQRSQASTRSSPTSRSAAASPGSGRRRPPTDRRIAGRAGAGSSPAHPRPGRISALRSSPARRPRLPPVGSGGAFHFCRNCRRRLRDDRRPRAQVVGGGPGRPGRQAPAAAVDDRCTTSSGCRCRRASSSAGRRGCCRRTGSARSRRRRRGGQAVGATGGVRDDLPGPGAVVRPALVPADRAVGSCLQG